MAFIVVEMFSVQAVSVFVNLQPVGVIIPTIGSG